MKTFSEIIYIFLKRNKFFANWKKILLEHLGKKYKFYFFYNSKKFLEKILFQPPSMIIYYYPKDPKAFENLVSIKKEFNLRIIPLLLMVDSLDFEFLLAKADIVDDFIITSEGTAETILRIEYAFKRLDRVADNNPLTGLPGNTSIAKTIKRVIYSKKPYAVAYVDLDNFKSYNDTYGFSKGDEMIKNLARIILNSVVEFSPEDYFVGHIGGDDFVFIVPLDRMEKICQEIIKRFDSTVPYFVGSKDLDQGYFMCKNRQGKMCKIPLPSVSIAVVPVYENKFNHIGEVTERAAEVKSVVKKMKGSNYFIDRRA